jgi:hypothetical protein
LVVQNSLFLHQRGGRDAWNAGARRDQLEQNGLSLRASLSVSSFNWFKMVEG